MRSDGSLIGQLSEPSIGHDTLSYAYPGLRSLLASGQAIAITIGKRRDGTIVVFGSGCFPPPGGGPLSDHFKELAAKLVE
jgi:hypothetical protein